MAKTDNDSGGTDLGFEDQLWNAADAKLGPIIERLTAMSIESRSLAELRDTLLPQLLTGELSVADSKRVARTAR